MCSTCRMLGSSFQNAQCTSPKIFRRINSSAWSKVGALESGFTVEPCPTRIRALSGFNAMRGTYARVAPKGRRENKLSVGTGNQNNSRWSGACAPLRVADGLGPLSGLDA